MREPEPVLAADLFPEERAALLSLLADLSAEDWTLSTACPGWSVKDVAGHVLGDDVGILSRKRDGFSSPMEETGDWDELVAFLNRWNQTWVEAARRISPQLLIDLLRFTGEEAARYFASLDSFEMGGPVSWAGPDPAPVWLDVAREYTERWPHQQQVRDAVGRPGLKGRRFFSPVLATFVRALPHTFREVEAATGKHVRLTVSGAAGGAWSVVRVDGRSAPGVDVEGIPDAEVIADPDTVWRLFTKGLRPADACALVTFRGDRALGEKVLETVSIIA